MTQETSKTTSPEEKRRTSAQNNALHLWYELLAKELNDKGIAMTTVLQKFILDTPATKYTVKELIWRPLQIALLGKTSTTELLKKEEIDQIYDSLVKFFAETMELEIPHFPSMEEVFFKEL